MRSIAAGAPRLAALLSCLCLLQALNGCRPFDPPAPDGTYAACCGGQGSCLPRGLIPDGYTMGLDQNSCGAALLCVPNAVTRSKGAGFASCWSSSGAEGRCVPECVTAASTLAKELRRDECDPEQLCVPCFDPLEGADTGVCNVGDDPGPSTPAQRFADCCGGDGRCVPGALVPEGQRAHLDAGSCSGQDALCVPLELARDPQAVTPSCRVQSTGAEGRCLLSCLPEVARRAQSLTQDDCAGSQLCVPCYDPLSGEPTGACELGGDGGPSEPPVRLPQCCQGRGACVPGALVPEEQRAHLGAVDCEPGGLCAPRRLLDDAAPPPASCRDPVLDAEGRCLDVCLQSVADQLDRLRRGDCQDNERCVPCYDPLDGSATGACSLSPDDPGPTEPPHRFPACCGSGDDSLGLCVPAALLPVDSPALPALSCPDEGSVCAPRALVINPDAPPTRCVSLLTTAGVCVPACMLSVTQLAATARGSCVLGESCVPCALFGIATGACE